MKERGWWWVLLRSSRRKQTENVSVFANVLSFYRGVVSVTSHIGVLLYCTSTRGYSYSVDFAWMKCQQCRQLISESTCSGDRRPVVFVPYVMKERPAAVGVDWLVWRSLFRPPQTSPVTSRPLSLKRTVSECHRTWSVLCFAKSPLISRINISLRIMWKSVWSKVV